jgi:CubicO group peptidase (beta-lactamase class C family)
MKIVKWGLGAAVLAALVFLGRDYAFWYNWGRSEIFGRAANYEAAETYFPLEKIEGVVAPRMNAAIAADADQVFAAALANAEATGSWALLVWHEGALRLEKYWIADMAEKRAQTASMHKSVLALAFGAALAEGKIKSLEQPVSDFIGEWKSDPRGSITIRDALEMSTGLGSFAPKQGAFEENTRFLLGGDLVRLTLSRPLNGVPGEAFEYLNVNSQLAGIVLQRALAPERYADFLSRTIWQKIGAGDAYVWPDEIGGTVRTFAAILATPRDWVRIGALIKDQGRVGSETVLPESWIAAMETPDPRYPNYGLQLWLSNLYEPVRFYNARKAGLAVRQSEPFAVNDLVYFDGFAGQRVYISRTADLVIVRIGEERPRDWDESALPNAVIRALGLSLAPQAAATPPANAVQ